MGSRQRVPQDDFSVQHQRLVSSALLVHCRIKDAVRAHAAMLVALSAVVPCGAVLQQMQLNALAYTPALHNSARGG